MPFGARVRAKHVDDLIEELGEVHGVPVEPQQPVLDLGNVEQPVDEAGHVLGAAPDHADRVVRRPGDAALQKLRVAEDRIERCAHLVAHADDVAGLGDVRGFGGFFRLLQSCVGALVRLDFFHEHRRLARRLGLGGAPALVRQHDAPRRDARQHQQAQEHEPQRVADMTSRSSDRRIHRTGDR